MWVQLYFYCCCYYSLLLYVGTASIMKPSIHIWVRLRLLDVSHTLPHLPSFPLQGPPGTGKTRTIMGIVGVLLAGGCPHATGLNTPPVGAAKVTVGASVSVTPGKGRGKAKGKNKNTNKGKGVVVPSPLFNRDVRVLIVAPSNAAVDELVHRLCQEGVPGHDGEVFFPRVVRVGGPREDPEGAGEAGNGAAGGMGGGMERNGRRPLILCRWVGGSVGRRVSNWVHDMVGWLGAWVDGLVGGWGGASEFELIFGRGHRCPVFFNSSMTCSFGGGALQARAVVDVRTDQSTDAPSGVVLVVYLVVKVRKT